MSRLAKRIIAKQPKPKPPTITAAPSVTAMKRIQTALGVPRPAKHKKPTR
jgi:hypothetical protein